MNDISNIKIKTDIAYPEYVTVIRKCMEAVRKAYPKRGNDWKYETKEYWITRLRNELSEFENAGTNEQQQGKLINIINFCSMMHHIINTIPPSYAEYYDDEEDAKDRQEKKESMEMAEEHERISKVRNQKVLPESKEVELTSEAEEDEYCQECGKWQPFNPIHHPGEAVTCIRCSIENDDRKKQSIKDAEYKQYKKESREKAEEHRRISKVRNHE